MAIKTQPTLPCSLTSRKLAKGKTNRCGGEWAHSLEKTLPNLYSNPELTKVQYWYRDNGRNENVPSADTWQLATSLLLVPSTKLEYLRFQVPSETDPNDYCPVHMQHSALSRVYFLLLCCYFYGWLVKEWHRPKQADKDLKLAFHLGLPTRGGDWKVTKEIFQQLTHVTSNL